MGKSYLAGSACRRRSGGALVLGPREQVRGRGVGAPHRRRPLHLLATTPSLTGTASLFLTLGVSSLLSLSKKQGSEDWKRCEPRELSGAGGWPDGAGSLFFAAFFSFRVVATTFFVPTDRLGLSSITGALIFRACRTG
jgi:hypothetical protein